MEMFWVGSLIMKPVMSTEHSSFTYAMCSSFLKAVTETLSISVEAAWGLQLNARSIVQMSESLSCSYKNYT